MYIFVFIKVFSLRSKFAITGSFDQESERCYSAYYRETASQGDNIKLPDKILLHHYRLTVFLTY